MSLLFALICTLLPLLAASAEENGKVLRIGMELSYPPFEMIDPAGQPTGISVGMAEALGQYLKRPIAIQNISYIGLIPSLKTGKIDLIISSLSLTPERQKSIDFSIPYLKTGLCLLISDQSNLTSIEDANEKGRTIVVKQGTTGEQYARKFLTQPKILILDKESSCVLEVVQGKADAFIYDQFSIFTNWQKNQTTTRANLIPFHEECWAIGLRQGDEELKQQVNAFLIEFKQEKGFEKLADQYLKTQQEAFKKMGIQIFL